MKLYEVTFERVEVASIVVEAGNTDQASERARECLSEAIWERASNPYVVETAMFDAEPETVYVNAKGKVCEVEE